MLQVLETGTVLNRPFWCRFSFGCVKVIPHELALALRDGPGHVPFISMGAVMRRPGLHLASENPTQHMLKRLQRRNYHSVTSVYEEGWHHKTGQVSQATGEKGSLGDNNKINKQNSKMIQEWGGFFKLLVLKRNTICLQDSS